MKKLDYFKLAIQHQKYVTKKWIVSAFAVTQSAQTIEHIGNFDILSTPTGYYFKNAGGKPERIEDADPKEPIFRFLDPILVDKSWIPNAPDKPSQTTYGNVIFNQCVILNSLGMKLDFVFGKVNIEKIETEIAKRLTNDFDELKKPSDIHVSEYVKFVDSLQFITNLAQLCVVSATEKSIQIAPGLEEFKKTLISKYGSKLDDPTEYVKFETELKDFDDKYLKDDPSTRGFMTGRIKNIARKKMYLTLGADASFSESQSQTPVMNSLYEGWPIEDPKQFTAMMNALRFASFSRGNETVRGGVAAKILLRSASNYKILDVDCGTTIGMTRTYKDYDIENLVGRYVIMQKKSSIVDTIEQAKSFIGKTIQVRSPMYCKTPGEAICKICAGRSLSTLPNGLTIPLTDISSIILNTSMKAMHGKVLSVAEMDLNEVMS